MNYLKQLINKYPILSTNKEEITKAFEIMMNCYKDGGKILICGNGGSAADAEHIVGELMKGFRLKRELTKEQIENIKKEYPNEFKVIVKNLQQAIPAVSLVGSVSLSTAYANDINSDYIFAQQVFGLGNINDVLIAISTSGNSNNVVLAAKIAKVKSMKIISLTGKKENILEGISNVTIKAPSNDTAEIQEYHLPIYHCLCSMLEDVLF